MTLAKRIRRDLRAAWKGAARANKRGVAVEYEATYFNLHNIDKNGDWTFGGDFDLNVEAGGAGGEGGISGDRSLAGDETANIRIRVYNVMALEGLDEDDEDDL